LIDWAQGCNDLSLGWRRTDSLQYSQKGGGGEVRHLASDGSATTIQRSHPCFISAADLTDDSPERQSSSASFHHDKYGFVAVDLARRCPSTRQPDAGLDLDLVNGVVERPTVDGGGRPPRELMPVDRTPLSESRRGRSDRGRARATPSTTPPRRVNFDVGVTQPAYRPACNCGSGTDHSPYYFKLDDNDGPVVTSTANDRSPLIAGHPVTSDSRHADVMIGSQGRDEL